MREVLIYYKKRQLVTFLIFMIMLCFCIKIMNVETVSASESNNEDKDFTELTQEKIVHDAVKELMVGGADLVYYASVPNGEISTAGNKLFHGAKGALDTCKAVDELFDASEYQHEHTSLNALDGGMKAITAVFSALDMAFTENQAYKPISKIIKFISRDIDENFIGNGLADRIIAEDEALGIILTPIDEACNIMFGSDGGKTWADLLISIGYSVDDSREVIRELSNYSFFEIIQYLWSRQKGGYGVKAYKPVIYFYDFEGDKIRIAFEYDYLLTETIPEYLDEWVVSTKEGKIVDSEGNEYPNLYYESINDPKYFDFSEGFYVNSGNRAEQFASILSEYGFIDSEISEFVEFWDEKLNKDMDYIMYPQYTEIVDRTMPISVTPEPETMVRIWFVFRKADGCEYKEANVVSFERKGYTMIEWGGLEY